MHCFQLVIERSYRCYYKPHQTPASQHVTALFLSIRKTAAQTVNTPRLHAEKICLKVQGLGIRTLHHEKKLATRLQDVCFALQIKILYSHVSRSPGRKCYQTQAPHHIVHRDKPDQSLYRSGHYILLGYKDEMHCLLF